MRVLAALPMNILSITRNYVSAETRRRGERSGQRWPIALRQSHRSPVARTSQFSSASPRLKTLVHSGFNLLRRCVARNETSTVDLREYAIAGIAKISKILRSKRFSNHGDFWLFLQFWHIRMA